MTKNIFQKISDFVFEVPEPQLVVSAGLAGQAGDCLHGLDSDLTLDTRGHLVPTLPQ